MKLTLNVKKTEVNIIPSEETISENFTLDFGYIFRGKSAYDQAVEGGYKGSEADYNSMLAQVPDAIHADDVVDSLTSTATNKPLSANQGRILDNKKVDKVPGKGLSTNDYSNEDKKRLAEHTIDITNIIGGLSELTSSKISKVKNSEGYIPIFSADGSLLSSGKTVADFDGIISGELYLGMNAYDIFIALYNGRNVLVPFNVGETQLFVSPKITALEGNILQLSLYAIVNGKSYSQVFTLSNDFKIVRVGAIESAIVGGDSLGCILTTYSELKALRDNGELVAGSFYRITDYECTTAQAEIRSANHPFDIIVQALDERTLSENAQAVAREGDDYFANCNLEAWQLKYTIDNDTTRHSWAKVEVLEQPQKWECAWGVLDSSYDNSSSTDYQEVDIDGETWCLYRPLEPTSHLLGYSLYRKEYVGESITDVNELVFVSDEAPTYYEDEYESYWENWPNEIRVMTKSGNVVTTLYNYSDYTYYDANDADQSYPIDFATDFEYDEELGAYRYSTPDGVLDWWDYFMGGMFGVVNYIPYTGDARNLSYAFESPLGKGYTYVYKVSDGTYIYTTENEEEDWEQSIDTVQYTAYVPYEAGSKGVIYEMIDEYNNHCPYDFKNMQFLHEKEWYYTFSFKGNDLSLTDYCADNYIYTNRMTKWDTTTTPVPNALPKVIFNARPNASGKTAGITHNYLNVSVEKGYICATRIENLLWQARMGGDLAVVNNLYVNLSGVFYGNTISGAAHDFAVGTNDAPATAFYDNQIYLPTYAKGDFLCNASTFVNNVLNLTESSSGLNSNTKLYAGFSITAGSITSCNIESVNYEKSQPIDAIALGINTVMRDCTIKIYKSLTINYGNTTSTTSPLRFLNIDARGWEASSINILPEFPVNSPYELKVAKDSKGNVQMWCDADLVN